MLVFDMSLETLHIEPILNNIKRTHPSLKSKISEYVDRLVSMIDSYIARHKNLTDDELVFLGEKLEKVIETSYYVYNELRSRTRYPSVLDRAVSKLRWKRIQDKVRSSSRKS